MAEVMPVDEADRQLDRRLRMAHEILQVDPEEPEKVDDARDRRFADADRRDIGRLDELDRARRAELSGQRARCDPARRAAADDGDPLDATIGLHGILLGGCPRSVAQGGRLKQRGAIGVSRPPRVTRTSSQKLPRMPNSMRRDPESNANGRFSNCRY